MVSIASSIHNNHNRGAVGDFLFLFGEPGFIRSLDPDKTVKKFGSSHKRMHKNGINS